MFSNSDKITCKILIKSIDEFFLPDSFLNFHYFIRLLCVMVLLTIYWIQCCTSRQKWISAMFTSE